MTSDQTPAPIVLKHKIDPLIDCVFKALFGEEQSKGLLIDFLNSILRPASLIADVTLINTAHEIPQLDGKLTTVDIKAKNQAGAIFHVEVQLALHPSRNERTLFYWATMYSRQITEGQKYHLLQPVTSIWVFRKPIWKDNIHHHRFEVWDQQTNLRLSDHLSIHTLELEKWKPPQGEASGEDLWLHFLRNARDWQALPEPLIHQPQMRQAMNILKKFSDDEVEFHRYFSRLDAERVQLELEEEASTAKENLLRAQQEYARLQAETAQAQQEAAQAQQEAAQAQQEAAQAQQEAAQAQQKIAQAQQKTAEAQQEAAQAAALAQQEAHAREIAQQEAAQAYQKATLARQEAAQAAALAQQEAHACEAALQRALDAEQQTREIQAREAAQTDALRSAIRQLYEVRFGPLPAPLEAALAIAPAQTLSQYLPRFATASQDALLALCLGASASEEMQASKNER